MSSPQTTNTLANTLVARFLRANNYKDALEAFIREAKLPGDVGKATTSTEATATNESRINAADQGSDEWTLEGVLQEKVSFEASLGLERADNNGNGEKESGWRVPAPTKPWEIPISSPSNVLAVSVEPWVDVSSTAPASPYLVATGANRQVHLRATKGTNHDGTSAHTISLDGLSDSPILSYVSVFGGEFVFMTNMSGQLELVRGTKVMDTRRDHGKYVVKVVAHEFQDQGQGGKRGVWVATAGWDARIFVYRFHLERPQQQQQQRSSSFVEPANNDDGQYAIGNPVASIDLPSNPESVLFTTHPDSGRLVLVVARRDSSNLYYYGIGEEGESTTTHQHGHVECNLLGTQNLAPHSIAWVPFSPSCLALSPRDPGVIAVATSTTPYMKLIIARLLYPVDNHSHNRIRDSNQTQSQNPTTPPSDPDPESTLTQSLTTLTLADQNRNENDARNREDAAILTQTNTYAPQTAYSTPQVAWRPDGSGVWVNADDGVIRGVEAGTGRVVCLLNGHRGESRSGSGCKVRCVWGGWVDVWDGDRKAVVREEWMVSGGFDRRVLVWRVEGGE